MMYILCGIWLLFNVLNLNKKILFGKTSFTSANIPSLIHRLSLKKAYHDKVDSIIYRTIPILELIEQIDDTLYLFKNSTDRSVVGPMGGYGLSDGNGSVLGPFLGQTRLVSGHTHFYTDTNILYRWENRPTHTYDRYDGYVSSEGRTIARLGLSLGVYPSFCVNIRPV